MNTETDYMRYRQLGYGHADYASPKWLAVWLDCESCTAGNLVTVQYPDGKHPVPYNDTIYRTLHDMLQAIDERG